jgi:hypothetical protein
VLLSQGEEYHHNDHDQAPASVPGLWRRPIIVGIKEGDIPFLAVQPHFSVSLDGVKFHSDNDDKADYAGPEAPKGLVYDESVIGPGRERLNPLAGP